MCATGGGGRLSPLQPTPENTSSGSDAGIVWSEMERDDEEEEADDVSLATGTKGKEAAVQPVPSSTRACTAPAPKAGAALVGEGTAAGGRAVRSIFEEAQASGVILMVSVESSLSYLISFGRDPDFPLFLSPSRDGSPVSPELVPTKALRLEARNTVRAMRPRSVRTTRPAVAAASRGVARGGERAHAAAPKSGGGSRGRAPRISGAGEVPPMMNVTVPWDGTLVEDGGVSPCLECASGGPSQGVGVSSSC